ncbi:hypothetical protein [Dokdonia sp.]|uniref:hypothetical protein n=1 Tax=Dokdonia sp. TaxID=2024995 RepID=UPI003264BD64
MHYQLFFGDRELGSIQLISQDFPNLFGHYKLVPTIKEDTGLLGQYIQHSVQANILMESDEEAWLALIAKEEDLFLELIESNAWKLIDSKKEEHNILIPNFCDKKEVVWRWA